VIHLSVNVNKVATVRNSRGGRVPSPVEAARAAIEAGAHGITVHPRADARHITSVDVYQIAKVIPAHVEYNIEGDPRPDVLAMAAESGATQCTLVPVRPGEITSQAGWDPATASPEVGHAIEGLHGHGIRVSLFVDPDPDAIRWAANTGADRIELYTEPFARAFEEGEDEARAIFTLYSDAACLASSLGLGVNAGHDLDLRNLVLFRELPHLDEVSIGHALISRALFVGLPMVVREYLEVLSPQS
jgi:pyridoxine 5-phosphate synthase